MMNPYTGFNKDVNNLLINDEASTSFNGNVVQDPKYIEAVKKLHKDFLISISVNKNEEKNISNVRKLLNSRKLSFNKLRTAMNSSPSDNKMCIDSKSADETTILNDRIRENRLRQIEEIMENFMNDIMNDKPPKIILHNTRLWSNCLFDDRIQLDTQSNVQKTSISFGSKSSRKKFCLMVHLLSTLYQMLIKQSTCTKRELYYQNISWVKSQIFIDNAIANICCCLNAPPWELGILATSKGLIAGPLEITTSDGHTIQCMTGGGILIPQNVIGIKSVISNAKFILVIEKDTIFQKLLDEGALERLSPCILITGKGYPDVNTRLMLKLLVDNLKIPSLALVDGDPHGIEIMCTYRFGSLAMSHLAEKLAVPSLRWLGVHPSDITELGAASLPLTSRDVSKGNGLLSRPYCTSEPMLRNQIEFLLQENKKTDIEAIGTMSQAYLTDRYIPHKIYSSCLI